MVILIIDPHPVLRFGFRTLLNEHVGNIQLAEASGISEYYQKFERTRIDLIFLSVTGHEDRRDNYKDISLLRTTHTEVPIVLLTDGVDQKIIPHYIKAGATGYLSKQGDPFRMVKYIKVSLEKNVPLDITNLMGEDELSSVSNTIQSLTVREYEIAKYLTGSLRQKEIAEKLGLSVQTISQTKAKIFRKLGIENLLMLNQVIDYVQVKVSKKLPEGRQ